MDQAPDKAPGTQGQGLPSTFEQDALSHLDMLFRVAQRYCRNPAQAQDLVQETYFKAWRYRAQFKPGSSVRAWLFSILKNTFFNELKHDKFMDRGVEIETLPLTSREPEVGSQGYGDAVTLALRGLPDKQRQVLLLSDVEEWSYEEIAQALQCPKNTVGTLLRRARQAMRKKLSSKDS